MKEYKVEKITKYEALDKVNNVIYKNVFLAGISTVGIMVSLQLTAISIIPFFASFPLAAVLGNTLDSLEDEIKTRKKILSMPDCTIFNNIIGGRKKLTQEEMNKVVELYELANKNDNEEIRSIKR